MSKTDKKNLHIKRKALSGKTSSDVPGMSLKASKAASIKHVEKHSGTSTPRTSDSSDKKSEKITFIKTEEINEVPKEAAAAKSAEKDASIDLIWSSTDSEQTAKPSGHIRWGLIIPAIIVVLCMGLFAVASQAGWIQSFLTPEEKLIKATTTTEETTPVPTTTEKQTTTTETTTEETTTEFIPSYYVINVNLAYNVVTVYTRGEKLNDGWDPADPLDDEYVLDPVIAFTCSPGIDGATPTGRYYLSQRAAWCFMIGDVYTQYATRIVDDVMFHSVPYYEENPGTLETDQYNILGYEASSACIRLNVRDAAWIFNYCADDTEVNIFYNWEYYGPLDPEPIYRIPEDVPELAGWDPTDIYSPGNPWFTYSASITSDTIYLPCYSSVDTLIAHIGPTDEYGNNLSSHFYTDGNYNLDYPGTYDTTGYIEVGNLQFSFPISITVTEEIAEEYYYDNSDDDYSEYSEDGDENLDWEGDDTGYDEGADDEGSYDEGSYDEGSYDEGNYDEGSYDEGSYDEGNYDEGSYDEGTYDEGSYDEGSYDEGTYDEGSYEEPVY